MKTLTAKVLIVDDKPELLDIAAFLVKRAGFDTLPAENGAQALELMRRHQDIRLVLSDIQMPIMDGVQFLNLSRAEFPNVPVILLSGGSSYTEEELIKLGALEYISKPYSPAYLEQRVQECLGGEAASLALGNAAIFLVEDELEDQERFRWTIRKLGQEANAEFHFFQTGEELLVQLPSLSEPSLVILDINLPGMSGLEILGALKSTQPVPQSTRIIMLTGSQNPRDREQALHLGADSYFQKPQTQQELFHLVRAIFQSWIPSRA